MTVVARDGIVERPAAFGRAGHLAVQASGFSVLLLDGRAARLDASECGLKLAFLGLGFVACGQLSLGADGVTRLISEAGKPIRSRGLVAHVLLSYAPHTHVVLDAGEVLAAIRGAFSE
jgi:hypothetical protein